VARCSANAVVFLRAARCLAAADRAGGILLLDLESLSVSDFTRTHPLWPFSLPLSHP